MARHPEAEVLLRDFLSFKDRNARTETIESVLTRGLVNPSIPELNRQTLTGSAPGGLGEPAYKSAFKTGLNKPAYTSALDRLGSEPTYKSLLDVAKSTPVLPNQPKKAFAIDIGCYAHLRKLDGRFGEIDVSSPELKERARSAPIFDVADLQKGLTSTPVDVKKAILTDEAA